ncbi:family 1 glycosyltransferase [Cryphonectria parasitica EP155]|uniref:Family 1 glycosyltransferase n=1 Tax=Cryphonectria parasitica (strain ATCC 38755 / EP155) TaxID=660469 RepID=A0A9P5CMY3_CRYP1|nr:family 1 glycosyltransferase [Cryphonectria parasitica EP155]KAF3764598.1 family 1 glycosyltransferase [Cryphonectria parasitica EP155]
MAAPKKILFICSSDYGQANVILATSYALMATGAPLEMHVASEHPMKPEVEHTMALADETIKTAAPYKLHFHGITGVSHFEAMSRPQAGVMDAWSLPLPNFSNASVFMGRFSYGAMPWEPEEVVDLYAQTVSIIKEVQPELTVIDPLYLPGLTAAHYLKVKWTVLAPNTIKDFAVPCQPKGAALWKYPVIGSGLPYPVPWSQMAHNIGLTLILAKTMLTDNRTKTAVRLLREHTGDENLQMMSLAELGVVHAPPPGLRLISAFSPDLDYPLDIIPSHVIPVGPIVRYAKKLADIDPTLDQWLSRGPTVYINLGTQLKMTPAEALEMALSVRDLLDAAGASSKMQVLWKLKRKAGDAKDGEWKVVHDTLLPEIETGRVRITSWVKADPCSILLSGRVVCSVHHGGANSHHEALAAGVPQVVLPSWIDCYDFGNRVELNGVGIRANKTAAPRWARAELGTALKDILIGEKAVAFRENAKKLAEKHPEHAGRTKAADVILDILNT